MQTVPSFAVFAAAALLSGTAVFAAAPAQTRTAQKTPLHAVTAKKTIAAKPMMAKPVMTTSRRAAPPAATATAKGIDGRMVTTKTTTGKTITYNCGKAGNANKQACKNHG